MLLESICLLLELNQPLQHLITANEDLFNYKIQTNQVENWKEIVNILFKKNSNAACLHWLKYISPFNYNLIHGFE